jgi:hypothetical protein
MFFGLPAVELNIFDMCDLLAVLPVVVSHDIQRACAAPPLETVYRHTQKLFSIAHRSSRLREFMNVRMSNRDEFQSITRRAI